MEEISLISITWEGKLCDWTEGGEVASFLDTDGVGPTQRTVDSDGDDDFCKNSVLNTVSFLK